MITIYTITANIAYIISDKRNKDERDEAIGRIIGKKRSQDYDFHILSVHEDYRDDATIAPLYKLIVKDAELEKTVSWQHHDFTLILSNPPDHSELFSEHFIYERIKEPKGSVQPNPGLQPLSVGGTVVYDIISAGEVQPAKTEIKEEQPGNQGTGEREGPMPTNETLQGHSDGS